jgi:DNA-binding NtrC family response regulator
MNDRRSARILIVDDEPAILTSHAAILERLGYEVAQAETADQAYRFLDESNFDLLICDLSLRGASGLDVIVDSLRRNPALPVILMTGYTDISLPPELSNANFRLMSKPSNVPELIRTIRGLLSGPSQERAAD